MSWNWQPLIVSGLLLSISMYSIGTIRLWRHAGAGHGVRWWQAAAFGGGWLSIVIALVSPIDTLSEIFSPLWRNSVYTSVIIGFACPLVGVFLVLRRLVFMGVALPQISSTGVAIVRRKA